MEVKSFLSSTSDPTLYIKQTTIGLISARCDDQGLICLELHADIFSGELSFLRCLEYNSYYALQCNIILQTVLPTSLPTTI
jgi:hypothetical protein